jgi:hypothetical protein
MNIIGNSFDEPIRKEINNREQILSKSNRDSNTIRYYNKSSWVRLASSVNIEASPVDQEAIDKAEKLNKLFNVGYGSAAAKNLVLFNSISDVSNADTDTSIAPQRKGGINRSNTLINDNAYGFGGDKFGYKPAPGITGVNVKFYNEGSLLEADISIKCFNVQQLEMLEVLYMHPGYTILLEWGHEMYLDINGTPTSRDSFSTQPFDLLFTDGTQQEEILEAIVNERKKNSYSYDGFYGTITNFSWTFNKDASYDVKIKVITLGSVIESLKISAYGGKKEKAGTENEADKTGEITKESIISNQDKTKIHKSIAYLINIWDRPDPAGFVKKLQKDRIDVVKEFVKLKIKAPSKFFGFSKSGSENYYITLGRFLYLLQDLMIYKDFKNKTPYIKFDYSYDDNYCLTFPEQFPADPSICLIPTKKHGLKHIGNIFRNKTKPFAGNLMGIHVNVFFIIKMLEESINIDNQTAVLIDFLQKILAGIQGSLGGINNFSIKFNTDTNTIRIYDLNLNDNNINSEVISETKITTLRPYGFKENVQASIITDISFETSLTNEMASQVAIGAQARADNIAENSTSFSYFNLGLKDRIIIEKKLENNINTSSSSLFENKIKETEAKVNAYLNKIWDLTEASSEESEVMLSLNVDYSSDFISYYVSKRYMSSPFFIPFNLNITMDGISGIRIYERFRLTEGILPSSYNGVIDFLITGVEHNITKNRWTTSLTTTAVPTTNKIESYKPRKFTDEVMNEIIRNTSAGGEFPPPSGKFPNRVPKTKLIYKSNFNNQVDPSEAYTIKDKVNGLEIIPKGPLTEFLQEWANQNPGYIINITSGMRNPAQSVNANSDPNTSPHSITRKGDKYNAIDLNIHDAVTKQNILSLKSNKADWNASGLPELALFMGIQWGGTFSSSSGWANDFVHFHVKI